MYDFPSDPLGSSRPSTAPGPEERRQSVLSLVLLIAAVAILGAIALGFTFWALGFLFHIVGVLLRIALIVAVAGLVWRRVTRGHWHRI
jgi:hypothetical protein